MQNALWRDVNLFEQPTSRGARRWVSMTRTAKTLGRMSSASFEQALVRKLEEVSQRLEQTMRGSFFCFIAERFHRWMEQFVD